MANARLAAYIFPETRRPNGRKEYWEMLPIEPSSCRERWDRLRRRNGWDRLYLKQRFGGGGAGRSNENLRIVSYFEVVWRGFRGRWGCRTIDDFTNWKLFYIKSVDFAVDNSYYPILIYIYIYFIFTFKTLNSVKKNHIRFTDPFQIIYTLSF